jgi:aryl-alcohol dehydrogenase-like predicted oxidoreductase
MTTANKLILGTVQMGLDYGINNSSGKISLENSCMILSKAFELGIDTLDTAEAYGNAHQVIGNFHELHPKIKFKVITKVPHDVIAEEIEQKIRTYINDLNVDHLEVLMFHSFDSYKNNKQIILILNNLKSKGLIKHIGVSIYTNSQIETLLLDDNITVVQMPFNLLDNESIRGDLMNKMKARGKVIHTRSAFLQGLFFKEQFENNSISQKLSNELIGIKNISKEENTSISNLALSYCLNQKDIDQVLIGVDSVNQLIDNLKAVDYKMNHDALIKINALKVDNLDLLNPSLWK